MKSVLISIQPYWVFLIIAKKMGWQIDKDKTIEVRKTFPKEKFWNKKVKIYCSKDKKSFSLIPKEYQPLMAQFLGKVIGDFIVCPNYEWHFKTILTLNNLMPNYEKGYMFFVEDLERTCLSYEEMVDYGKGKDLYGWHITDLKIYDKPKELSEFYTVCQKDNCFGCKYLCGEKGYEYDERGCGVYERKPIEHAPQSWCYVEEI